MALNGGNPARAAGGGPRPSLQGAHVPSSLFTQIFALVLATVVVAQLVSVALLVLVPPDPPRAISVRAIAAAIFRHDQTQLEFRLVPAAPAGMATPPTAAVARLQRHLALALGRPVEDIFIRVDTAEGRRFVEIYPNGARAAPEPALLGHFQLGIRQNQGWMLIEPRGGGLFDTRERRFLLLFLATAFAMLPVAWLFARRLARPFEQFADAAERIGGDSAAVLPVIRGPMEVERAADAVARMQQRLRAYIADRTQMLGAIVHDLRTPLMRLAFRAEALPADARAPIAADVAEMAAIMQATLGFVRAESDTAGRQRLELASLVENLVADLADTGRPVAMDAAETAVVDGDAVQLRRLLGNLLENAVAYGQRARVRVRQRGGRAIVDVDDYGPGIADADLERVFEPFFRLEGSRSRETGGTGLGLAVVRAIARGHGGDVELHNRAGGGLRARLVLPLAPPPDGG